jgi:PAS domain S-box-containing protein
MVIASRALTSLSGAARFTAAATAGSERAGAGDPMPAALPLLARLVEQARALSGCTSARLCLREPGGAARRGFAAAFAGTSCLAPGECVWMPRGARRPPGVIRGRRGGICTGSLRLIARTGAPAGCDLCGRHGFESVAVVPLHAGRRTAGVLHLADRRPGRLGREQLRLLETFAEGIDAAVAWGRVCEARHARGDLHQHEAPPVTMADAGLDAVLVAEARSGRLVHVNDIACELLGYSREELLATHIGDAPWARAMPDAPSPLRQIGRGVPQSGPVAVVRRDGLVMTVDFMGFPLRAARRRYVGMFLRTLEPPDRAQVRTLVASVEDRERRRLATELHDGVLQQLALIGLRLDHLRLTGRLPPAARRELGGIRRLFARSVRDLRSCVLQPAPADRAPRALCVGLERVVRQARAAARCPIELRDDGRPKPLGAAALRVGLRGVRELLSNAVRHARASRLVVSAALRRRAVRLAVEDDGIGFGRADRSAAGFGLESLRDDLAALGGRLVIRARPRAGTRVTLVLPLAQGAP